MLLFMTIYLSVYSLLNLYVFRWLKPAFDWKLRGSLVFLGFVVVMTAMTLVTRWLDRKDYFLLAQVSAILGYAWMLVVMWVFTFGMLAEFWNLFISILSMRFQSLTFLRLAPRVFIGIMAIFSCVMTAWGLFEARTVGLKTINITTGDIFDSENEERMGDYAVKFALLTSPSNRFAVLGNHEFYTGLDSSLYLFRISDFKLLRAERVTLNHNGTDIIIAGVDDEHGGRMGAECKSDDNAALPPASPGYHVSSTACAASISTPGVTALPELSATTIGLCRAARAVNSFLCGSGNSSVSRSPPRKPGTLIRNASPSRSGDSPTVAKITSAWPASVIASLSCASGGASHIK